jgi:arylsulfatase A-like enzyme
MLGMTAFGLFEKMRLFPLKVLSRGYFLCASIFCFAALNSYTYFFLVKSPPTALLIWFVAHASVLYWVAMAAEVASDWDKRHRKSMIALWLAQTAIGVLFAAQNTALNLRNDWTAFAWALALLLPVLLLTCSDAFGDKPENCEKDTGLFPYLPAASVALAAALISIAATILRNHLWAVPFQFQLVMDAQAVLFALSDYLWIALLSVSVINLLQLLAERTLGRRWPTRTWIVLLLMFLVLQESIVSFMNSTLSMQGFPVRTYAILLAAFLVLWTRTLWSAAFRAVTAIAAKKGLLGGSRVWLWLVLSCVSIMALIFPTWLGGDDWNGVVSSIFYLSFWSLLALTTYRLFPRRTSYSIPAIAAILIVGGTAHWALRATDYLGNTSAGLMNPSQVGTDQNDAWQLLRKAFDFHMDRVGTSNSQANQSCGELCRALREYSNVPNARVRQPIRLVENFQPAAAGKPNIFIFVIDSLRPDYLGAYNPAADFTPNLDSLARDSVVMRNAYTQYAGTSLSEPVIWSGALLLHAHYMRPFEYVNNLLTLGINDGYDVAVSYDHILRRIIPSSDNLTKFDVDKGISNLEIGSTLSQLTTWMEHRSSPDRPILFYTQPMNIHQMARLNLPQPTAENWRQRPGFNDRVAYRLHQTDEFLGEFFRYLKAKGLYDNSIIIVTADHGDAFPGLPGFGLQRRSHSTILFPEVMRVPLIIHLPATIRNRMVWDENRLATLTDITPSLYSLLGHGPLKRNQFFGQPLFCNSSSELASYHRDHLLLASDASADYGILTGDGRYLYAVYDSPLQSLLFDLKSDSKGTHNIVSDETAKEYNQQILSDLRDLAKFYKYRPAAGNSSGFAWDAVADWRKTPDAF